MAEIDESKVDIQLDDAFKYRLERFLQRWTLGSSQMASIEKSVAVLIDRKFESFKSDIQLQIDASRRVNGERMGSVEARLATMESDLKSEIKDLFHEMQLADSGFKHNFKLMGWAVSLVFPALFAIIAVVLTWVLNKVE